MPMASFLRQMGCTNKIGFFMHIPWPPADIATALPAFDRIVRSMTAYDLIGFQTELDAANFRSCLARANVCQSIGPNVCEAFGRRVQIEAMPISIDTDGFALEARLAEKNVIVKRTKASLENRQLVIGVDRLDYSKGIEQRICAFSTFLERSPQALKSRVTMLQVTPKSRSEVPEYAKIQRRVAEQVGNVNGKHGDVDWTPIRYINKPMSRSALAGLYRMAKVALVTPLRDGMNLVAKEYVAAQSPDDPGVLILSQFAGAAYELKSALIVNPYDIEATASAIARAFAMPLEERRDRFAAMMAVLSSNTIEHWSARFLEALGGQNEDCFDDQVLSVSEDFVAQERFIPPSSLWTRFGH
jgi:trehalose 6-phosphate synthase